MLFKFEIPPFALNDSCYSMQHFFLLLFVLLEHGRPLVATTLSSPTSSTSTMSFFVLLGPPVSASTSSVSPLPGPATSTTSPVMIVGPPVSASVSITGSTAEVTFFTQLIVSAVPTSTPSNATTLSKVTTNSFTTSNTLEVLLSSTSAATSASNAFSPTDTATSSSPLSSASLTPQRPSASSAGLTPQVKMDVGISAGILGTALAGVLIRVLVRFFSRRRMNKTSKPDENGQTTKLQDFDSINAQGHKFLTPYPNGVGHETMSYFATALRPEHVKPAQVQELWTPGFIRATPYERDRMSARYELDTEGGLL